MPDIDREVEDGIEALEALLERKAHGYARLSGPLPASSADEHYRRLLDGEIEPADYVQALTETVGRQAEERGDHLAANAGPSVSGHDHVDRFVALISDGRVDDPSAQRESSRMIFSLAWSDRSPVLWLAALVLAGFALIVPTILAGDVDWRIDFTSIWLGALSSVLAAALAQSFRYRGERRRLRAAGLRRRYERYERAVGQTSHR